MIDKVFKIGILIAIIVFLLLFYNASLANRYQVITEYEGNIGIFDTRQGVVYMLDLDKDEWSVIKPFSPNRPTI